MFLNGRNSANRSQRCKPGRGRARSMPAMATSSASPLSANSSSRSKGYSRPVMVEISLRMAADECDVSGAH